MNLAKTTEHAKTQKDRENTNMSASWMFRQPLSWRLHELAACIRLPLQVCFWGCRRGQEPRLQNCLQGQMFVNPIDGYRYCTHLLWFGHLRTSWFQIHPNSTIGLFYRERDSLGIRHFWTHSKMKASQVAWESCRFCLTPLWPLCRSFCILYSDSLRGHSLMRALCAKD